MLYFWVVCTHYQCSIIEPVYLLRSNDFSKNAFESVILQKLPQFSWDGMRIYFTWLSFQAILYAILPAKTGSGQRTPAGHILPYKVINRCLFC